MKPGLHQHGAPLRPSSQGRKAARRRPVRPLEDDDLCRWPAPRRAGGPSRSRWAHECSRFRGYVEQFLVPTLAPGDIVVMDNLASHKRPKARELIEAVEARLLFPSALQSRLQPYRDAVRQTQGVVAKGRRANRRRPMVRHRPMPRKLHAMAPVQAHILRKINGVKFHQNQ